MSNKKAVAVIDDRCCAPLVSEPLGESDALAMVPLLKALADPVRLRLVSLIASHEGGEACVCELTGAFELTAPTISHHLKVLREAGLLDAERRGTWIYYQVDPDAYRRISTLLAAGQPVPY